MNAPRYVLPRPPQPSVAVDGTAARFPVRRIYLAGHNYAAHAREMGGDPEREPPFFFMKPADAVTGDGAEVPYPPGTADLQHEVELVVAVGSGGRDLDPARALEHVYGYACGIDLTRRDLQAQAKAAGRPWEAGKVFEAAAAVGSIAPAERIGHPARGRIWLTVNGAVRQDGDLQDLVWSVAETLAHLSRLFTLAPGDLVFTGTPAGVGPVQRGDALHAGVDGVGDLRIRIC